MIFNNIGAVQKVNKLVEFAGRKKELPVKLSYAIRKNIVKLTTELKAYEEEHSKMLKGYDSKTDEEKKEQDEKYKELCSIEFDADIQMISMDLIEKMESISVQDLAMLEFMICDFDNENEKQQIESEVK